ncbi:MAG: NAD(P)H-quinone oxidoreductase [Rhodospirillales bacterium]|nr:NAD(P)H-quinone oxidoreductase [Rhodospirillales bacterium]
MEVQNNGQLAPVERHNPAPGPGEVLIRVKAAGINRPDLLQLAGHYPPPAGASDILGLECAGEIVQRGAGVTDWPVGEHVCALLNGGGYAEYATAPAGQCLPIPRGLTLTQAASLPETYFTVWSNLFDRAKLKAGESLLVHGGTSGIGVAAIQLASALGVRVMATAGSEEKCQACLDLGAMLAVDYNEHDFVPAAQEFGAQGNGANGVDVILDMVGGDYVARNIDALAPDGRLVNIAFLKGSRVQMDLMPVMLKRLTLTGSTLRPRPPAFKAAIAESLRTQAWPLFENTRIRPVVFATFPLKMANQALKLMKSGEHIGKIVLEMA